MADAYYGEDQTLKVYKWAEKEVSNTTPNGVLVAFTFDNTVVKLSGLHTTNAIPDYFEASAEGNLTFYKYSAGWITDTGFVAKRDCSVYFRKNNIDYPVDESAITSITGTTITFTNAPTTAVADAVVISYAYEDANADANLTFKVTSFDKSGGDRDVDVSFVLGGKSLIRKQPQDLMEFSITSLKNDVSLSQAVNGNIVKTTTEISGKTIRTTTGSGKRSTRALVLKSQDPVNSANNLQLIFRNVDGVTQEYSGGAEDALEETVSLKCRAEDYAELEIS